ncbi:hypothetical protein PR001_g12243 [Phytophthora rubi]|uniref:DDE Tnp4 domain-containing protein n=1 Tax=Phytophthora rubi TaxID=129364 RepID=A0A6A3MCL2_9STRA|nr:hypothetical protein PR001_g12243 [Phytophthora rubi]
MPSGTQADQAEYYRVKHKLRGYKTKVSGIPTGLAINCSNNRRRSGADNSIFCDSKAFHEAAATKKGLGEGIADCGSLLERFPSSWVILADKGNQVFYRHAARVNPKRRCQTVPLTVEVATNYNISSY